MLILQDIKILFGHAKYFSCFSKFLPVITFKVILLKDRKLQLLSIFRYQDIPKNGLHSEIISLPHSTTSLKVTWKTIIFLKFWLVIYKKQKNIHFGMGALLKICCIFSEQLLLGTPLGGCFWKNEWLLHFNKRSSSSRAIFKSILYSIQKVWHG